MQPAREISRLIDIMAALRDPESGCPWDVKQRFATIAPYTIEEAYEVADAIGRNDLLDLKDELGDLLLQVVFHARMAEEVGAFDFGDVVEAITTKLIRRHPHVFGDAGMLSPEAVNTLWGSIKADERAERRRARTAAGTPPTKDDDGALAGVPVALPALTRALKLQAKASDVGFDWHDAGLVLAKIQEEADEVAAALDGGSQAEVGEEIGDLLFAVVNLARHARVDPEASLRHANAKFQRRFGFIEDSLRSCGKLPQQSTLQDMDALWNAAKRAEASASGKAAPLPPHAPPGGNGIAEAPAQPVETLRRDAHG